MVEWSTRKREIRGDRGNHHEKLWRKRILCVSQFAIPDTASTSCNPAGKTPIWGLLHPIRQVITQISQVRSYPPYCSHLHPPSLSVLSTTLPSLQEHKVKSSLSISPWHHHELTPSTAYADHSIHLVQHTPSTAYTEYSIYRVQLTPSTAYT